ncbi:MAG: HINT domain-containing protein [Pirellula sp.]|nr:HINT domain-containing protein [Pirellula sp.]
MRAPENAYLKTQDSRLKTQDSRLKNSGTRRFRTLLLETLDHRHLFAVDLSLFPQPNGLFPQPNELLTPQHLANQQSQIPASENRLLETKSSIVSLRDQFFAGHSSNKPLANQLAAYSQRSSIDQQSNFKTAFQLAWNDFQTTVGADSIGLASSPAIASAISNIEDVSTQSLSLYKQRDDRDPSITGPNIAGIAPSALQPEGLLTSSLAMIGQPLAANRLPATNQANSANSVAISDHSSASDWSALGSSASGWVCQIDGSMAFVGTNSVLTDSQMIPEGESGDPADQPDSPFFIPSGSVPKSILATNQVTLDQFSPANNPVNVQTFTGAFNANTTRESADFSAPGTSSFHSINYNWVSPTQWSMTETIIFSFAYSSTDQLSDQLTPNPATSTPADGTPTYTPQGNATATIAASRFVSIVIVLHASRGIISHPDAGVAWSMDVKTSDRLSLSLNASASVGVVPNTTTSNPPNVPGNGASTWSPLSPLGNYTSSAYSGLALGFTVTLQHSIRASGTPSLVSSGTSNGAMEPETDFVYSASDNNSFQFFASAAAGSSSSSGNLNTAAPANGVFIDPSQFSSGGGTSGSQNGQGWDQSSGIAGGLENSPVPMPSEGIGHSAASSSASNSNMNTNSSSQFAFRGKLKADGKLSGITGDIRSQMQDAWNNSGKDNGVISLRISDSDANGQFSASMVSGKNTNWQAMISANANNELQVGVDAEGKLTATPADSATSMHAGTDSGNANFEFIATAGSGISQSGASTTIWSASGKSANAYLSSTSLQVGAEVTSPSVPPSGTPNQAAFDQNQSRHESESYHGRTVVIAFDPTRTALDGSPAFSKWDNELKESWSFSAGALGQFIATPDSNADGGVAVSGGTSGSSSESFEYKSDESFIKQAITAGTPFVPAHQESVNNKRSASYNVNANASISSTGTWDPVKGGDDRVKVTGTYASNSGPIGGLVNSSLDLETGIVTIASSIGFSTDDGEGTVSGGTLNGTYHIPNWDPRNNYEHILDGSPDPNPPSSNPTPAVVVAPAPRTKSWSDWGLELFAGSKGDAFDQGVNFVSGFGDGVTFGLSAKLRDLHGMDYVDKDTWAYFAGDVGSNFVPGPTAIAKQGTLVWKAYNKFDDLGVCANTLTKLVHGKCFVAGTSVAVSDLPYSAVRESTLWSETNWFDDHQDWNSLLPASGKEFGGEGLAVDLHIQKPTSLLNPIFKIPIEQVSIGSRVPTKNPRRWEYDFSLTEPHESTWKRFSLTAQDDEGAIVEAEFIRPDWWIEEHGIAGYATIETVEDCGPIARGDGSVVTGRFKTSRVNVIVRLTVAGPDGSIEVLEGTTVHPFWSVDRNDWIQLSELQEGERLQASDGIATVVSIALVSTNVSVYNIEVHGEHVYQVGELGLLVHNACQLPVLGRPMHGGVVHNSTMVGTALSWIRGGMTNVRTNQALSDGINTLSNLRPDVQGIANGLIHIAEVNVSGGRGYHAAREMLFRQILGSRFGSYLPL